MHNGDEDQQGCPRYEACDQEFLEPIEDANGIRRQYKRNENQDADPDLDVGGIYGESRGNVRDHKAMTLFSARCDLVRFAFGIQ